MNILTLWLALFMAYIGSGINIYHYCCDACRSHGHNIYLTISCEEVHASHRCADHSCNHANHRHNSSVCVHEDTGNLCTHLASTAKHCDVHHVAAPQLTQDNSHTPHFEIPLVATLPSFVITDNTLTPNTSEPCNVHSNAPPIRSGRAIIALKSSYII